MPLPRIGALLPYRADGADPVLPPARPDGDARHMSETPARTRAMRHHGRYGRSAAAFCRAWLALPCCVGDRAALAVLRLEHTAGMSGFVVSMLSQMGMMIIFALSYNMLMGQAGLLSFCHAVFFGLGGYVAIHFLNAAGDGDVCRCRWN